MKWLVSHLYMKLPMVLRKTYNDLEGENAALRAALRIAKDALSKDRLELKRMEQSRYDIVRLIEGVMNGQKLRS